MGHLLAGCGLGASAAGCAVLNGAPLWQAGLLYAACGAGIVLAVVAAGLVRGGAARGGRARALSRPRAS